MRKGARDYTANAIQAEIPKHLCDPLPGRLVKTQHCELRVCKHARSLSRTKESDSPTEELDQFLRSTKQSYSNIVRVEGVLTEDVQQESLVSSKAGFLLLRLAAVGW